MSALHATDIRTYLECRRKFYYANVLRLLKGEGEKPNYFEVGTRGHAILAAHYKNEETSYIIEEIPDTENKQLLSVLYKDYVEHYKETDSTWQIASVENQFKIEFMGIEIEFTIDLLIMIMQYYIVDHKFYSTMPSQTVIDLDFQISFYIWAANRLGIKVNNAILNCIKKKIPISPTMLQGGKGLSRSATELGKTDYQLYSNAIKMAGLNEVDYENELDYLKGRGSLTFQRFKTKRSDSFLVQFEEDLKFLIEEIMEAKITPRKFIAIPSLNCAWCPYEFLCKIQNDGRDIKQAINGMYTEKKDGER